MSRPLVVFGDAAAELANMIRAALAGRAEPYASGVVVDVRIPKNRRPAENPPPLVVFRQDGPGAIYQQANSRVTLRGSIWHQTEDDAFDLAQLVHAFVARHSGAVIRAVTNGLSPFVTSDPDTGEPLASFTVTANLYPQVIT